MISAAYRQVVVFTGRYDFKSTIEHVEALASAFPEWKFVVLQEKQHRRWLPYLKLKVKQIRRGDLSYLVHVAKETLRRLFSAGIVTVPHISFPETLADLKHRAVRYVQCASLHSQETREFLTSLRPWLGISVGAPILKPSVFRLPVLGTVNLHKGALPEYRGTPPGFWELHDGQTESGVSVHWIDEGLDTGPLITQRRLKVAPYTTPRGLAAQLDLLGSQVLVEAVREIDRNPQVGTPQPKPATPLRKRPPSPLARRVHRSYMQRRSSSSPRSFPRTWLKRTVLAAFVYLWVPIRNLWRRVRGTCQTTVLVYHRVSDDFLDTVTVGIEQFDQQLEMLRRKYQVVDMPTLLATRGQKQRHPRVALTFDDGYEDNFLAATLLRRRQLPCTFFISTRVVGSRSAFPHDLERLGHQVPSLSWGQVRQMAAWGFHFANHTADHANLGKVRLEEAIEQVATASKDLVRELGASSAANNWLAYPYGQPHDISSELRRCLPDLGIDSCFSAYGGSNPPGFDRMNIKRQGIHHGFDLLALRAAVEGWHFS